MKKSTIGCLAILIFFCIISSIIGKCSDTNSPSTSGSNNKSFTCAECEKNFSYQPYQAAFSIVVQAEEGQESSAMPYFCSCSCGVRYMAKQGLKYHCK